MACHIKFKIKTSECREKGIWFDQQFFFLLKLFDAVAKWPAAGQGFEITKWLAVWYFSQILRSRRNPSNSNYHMSINNCQAIQKSYIDRKSNAWFTLGSESETFVSLGRLPVTVFKLLNDRHSEFRESSEPIVYKLSVQYVNWEVSSDPKKFSLL